MTTIPNPPLHQSPSTEITLFQQAYQNNDEEGDEDHPQQFLLFDVASVAPIELLDVLIRLQVVSHHRRHLGGPVGFVCLGLKVMLSV